MKSIEEQNEERRQEIVDGIIASHPVPDSYQWQRAVALGATPDFSPADWGEEMEIRKYDNVH